jgi:hypothetical protein
MNDTSIHESSIAQQVEISNEAMLIESYKTMLINDKLENQNKLIKMKFAKTTHISFTNKTLVSSNKLKKKNYV